MRRPTGEREKCTPRTAKTRQLLCDFCSRAASKCRVFAYMDIYGTINMRYYLSLFSDSKSKNIILLYVRFKRHAIHELVHVICGEHIFKVDY